MNWKWKAPKGNAYDLSRETNVYEVNVSDGRAFVHMGSHGTRYDWFVMTLDGVEEGMSGWVQVTRAGAISPPFRSSEHFQRDEQHVSPGYMAEKFPGATRGEYEEMARVMIPFLSSVFDMDPIS